MTIKSSAITHVGMVRELNEDAFVERSDIGVWAVADGMGGHVAGDVASKAVTDAIKRLQAESEFTELVAATKHCLQAANQQLREQASSYEDDRVPGSTVAALVIKGYQGAVVWAGDSRIYQHANQQLVQLTRDHSHVQELVDQGLLKPEDAESHPMANVITRAIGIFDELDLGFQLFDVNPGDQFLLCSDGLSRMVSDPEIETIMANKNPKDTIQSLLHTALVRGAPDNVTLICLHDGDIISAEEEENDESTIVFPGFSPN